MHRQLDDLDGSVVARLDVHVGGEGHLREADGAGVGRLAGAEDLEGRDHGVGHVGRAAVGNAVGTLGAEAHVDVDEGCRMPGEPAWLECDGAAFC